MRVREPAEAQLYELAIDPALTLAMDRAHLHQILDSLLSNAARHASGKPGAVRLWAEALPHAKLALHVQDDGPGFDEAMRAHLFEPFFTTHPKGTGLGLYIARELAEANDATLALAPRASGAGHPYREPAMTQVNRRNRPRAADVLVVDDPRTTSANCSSSR